VYSFLPLGLRVMNKITTIIREEMNAIGGEELFLTALQDKNVWDTTGRWSDAVVDNWFKTKLKNGGDVGLGFTHEESLTALVGEYVNSFRDLPFSTYQIQTKFRNEARAKSGIMRGREFLMKDLYSFSRDEKEHLIFYEKAKEAYKNIFKRVGLSDYTYLTYASGGTFSKYSHEFQAITEAGEDIIYISKEDYGKGIEMDPNHAAINKEIFTDDLKKSLGLLGDFEEKKSVEIGNIFTLGTKYSEALGLSYTNETGQKIPVFMGSYGIGLGRLMGTIVEILSDGKGIIWPKSVAPFQVHMIGINQKNKPEVTKMINDTYESLKKAGVETLLDDREATAGEKFADSDLIGIPIRVVISEKSIGQNTFETKERTEKEPKQLSLQDIISLAN
jgi:prolyl-tRNA synthetase